MFGVDEVPFSKPRRLRLWEERPPPHPFSVWPPSGGRMEKW